MPDARDRDGGRYRSPDIRHRAPLSSAPRAGVTSSKAPTHLRSCPSVQPATRPLTGIAFTVAQ
ncbi:MAG: hypothetical protein R2932_03840 [Caldilineaceae bacterium]